MNKEIKCPECGKVFKIDESDYSKIVSQVRDAEFSKEMEFRIKHFEKEKNDAIEIEKKNAEMIRADALSKMKEDLTGQINTKDNEISELKVTIEKFELEKSIAVKNAEDAKEETIRQKEAEITELRARVEKFELEKSIAVKNAEDAKEETIRKMDAEISDLRNRQSNWDNEKNLALIQAENKKIEELRSKDNEITELKAKISQDEIAKKNEQSKLKEHYEYQLKEKDEEIERYKDFRAKQSTKMIGESLERYCEDEFNRYRATGFQNAYFEKDNEISESGSKGDFIFRESDDGVEFISIMFEMKNESETTVTKHRNEDFFKELDKDRREKGCEYAVLVSMLEADSDLYNNGIVDVSYKYPKMYVIRPQFFIPMITMLRNAQRNSLEQKRQLIIAENKNIDITNFVNDLNDQKNDFGRNFRITSDKFFKAIEEIDKTIDHLQKVKDQLMGANKNLRIANEKLDGITVKKLTKNNPTMKKMFDELEQGD